MENLTHAHVWKVKVKKSKIGKSEFHIAGSPLLLEIFVGVIVMDGVDGGRQGPQGEQFGEICASVWCSLQYSSGLSTAVWANFLLFDSFLLIVSFTNMSVLLCVMPVGLSCKAVKVKCTFGH